MNKNKNKIIVTGSAGFIGSSLSIKLLERGDSIIGIDNHNDYYDPKIKDARIERLTKYPNYRHYRLHLPLDLHHPVLYQKWSDHSGLVLAKHKLPGYSP